MVQQRGGFEKSKQFDAGPLFRRPHLSIVVLPFHEYRRPIPEQEYFLLMAWTEGALTTELCRELPDRS